MRSETSTSPKPETVLLGVRLALSKLRMWALRAGDWTNRTFPWVIHFGSWIGKTLPNTIRNSKWLLGIVWLAAGGYFLLNELRYTLSKPDEDVFNNAQAILLTLAAWVGVPFLIWRTMLANEQTQINREGQFTDRFTRAIETLGTTRLGNDGKHVPVIEARIGAIYALERLAKNSRDDYGAIIETLSAYVREQCGEPSQFVYNGQDPDEKGISVQEKTKRIRMWSEAVWRRNTELTLDPPANRADVKVALTVLSRRRSGRRWLRAFNPETEPDLSGVNLQGAQLSDVTQGLLSAETRIVNAHLDCVAFSGFEFENSTVNWIVVQHRAQSAVVVPKTLMGASLLGFTPRQDDSLPILDGSNISFSHMDKVNCANGHFRAARLINADFKGATGRNSKFGCSNGTGAHFDGADFTDSEFVGSLLHGASFIGANLTKCEFQDAYLSDAVFEGALLIETDLTGANELEQSMFETAFGSYNTKLPAHIAKPDHWTDDATAIQKWRAFRESKGMC